MPPPAPRRLLVEYHQRIVDAPRGHEPLTVARSRSALERLRTENDETNPCEASPAPDARPVHSQRSDRDESAEFETVWNGAIGRAGKSLTTMQGAGSSLAPGAAFMVTQ